MVRIFINALLICFLLTLTSCGHQLNSNRQLAVTKNSVLKLETWVQQVGGCDPAQQTCTKDETKEFLYSSGSGSIVLWRGKKVVLTAAHVCDVSDIQRQATMHYAKVSIHALDRTGRIINIRTIKLDHRLDVCIMAIKENIDLRPIRLSTKGVEYAERVYYIGAPLGIAERAMMPVFEGFFFGDDSRHALYGVPVAGGASGSPIVNSTGQLVGLVHSVHYRFHHIALSVRYSDLWNFLKK